MDWDPFFYVDMEIHCVFWRCIPGFPHYYCFDEMEETKRGKKIFKFEIKAKLAWLIMFLEFSFNQNVENFNLKKKN